MSINRALLRRRLVVAQLLAAPVGLIVLGWLLLSELSLDRLTDEAGTIAVAIIVGVAGLQLFAVRLRHVVELFELEVARGAIWRVHLVSLFYYFFLPAGLGYDLVRAAKVGAAASNPGTVRLAGLALTERLSGGLGLLLLLIGALPFTKLVDHDRLAWLDPPFWVWAVLLGTAVIGFFGLFAAARWRRPGLYSMFPAIAVSAVAQLIIAGGIWFATEGLAIEITLTEILVALAGTLLFQLIPVNLVGVSFGEVAAVAIYMAYGLSRPDAILLTTLAYLQRLVAALVGGGVEAVASARWLARTHPRRQATDEAVSPAPCRRAESATQFPDSSAEIDRPTS